MMLQVGEVTATSNQLQFEAGLSTELHATCYQIDHDVYIGYR